MISTIDQLQKLEKQRTDHMVHGDVERLGKLLDPILIYSHSTGAVDSRESFLEHLHSGFLKYKSVVPTVDHAVQLDPDTLLGTGRLRTNVLVADSLKQLDSRYMVVWHRTAEGWKLVALQG